MSLVDRTQIKRALIALGAIALLYGIAAEIGRWALPHRIWMDVHYIENVELLPPYRSLGEEMAFLLESWILPSSIAVSTGRAVGAFVLDSTIGSLIALTTRRALR